MCRIPSRVNRLNFIKIGLASGLTLVESIESSNCLINLFKTSSKLGYLYVEASDRVLTASASSGIYLSSSFSMKLIINN
jgi:hypothetical protein